MGLAATEVNVLELSACIAFSKEYPGLPFSLGDPFMPGLLGRSTGPLLTMGLCLPGDLSNLDNLFGLLNHGGPALLGSPFRAMTSA